MENKKRINLSSYTKKLKKAAFETVNEEIKKSLRYNSVQDINSDILESLEFPKDKKRTGVSKSTIYNFLNGSDTKESFLIPILICQKLGISLDNLFQNEAQSTKSYLLNLLNFIKMFKLEFIEFGNGEVALYSRDSFTSRTIAELSVINDADRQPWIQKKVEKYKELPERRIFPGNEKKRVHYLNFLKHNYPNLYFRELVEQFISAPLTLDDAPITIKDFDDLKFDRSLPQNRDIYGISDVPAEEKESMIKWINAILEQRRAWIMEYMYEVFTTEKIDNYTWSYQCPAPNCTIAEVTKLFSDFFEFGDGQVEQVEVVLHRGEKKSTYIDFLEEVENQMNDYLNDQYEKEFICAAEAFVKSRKLDKEIKENSK